MTRHPHIVNLDQIEWEAVSQGERYAWRRARLARAAGGAQLGASVYEIPPGKRSWPYHYHYGNEELLYVLEGHGTLRIPDEEVPLGPRDLVGFPVGPAGGHQLNNTSDAPLRVLMMSTMREPDIAHYPDSGKWGLFAGTAPGGAPDGRSEERFLSEGGSVAYWEGED